MLFLFFYSAGTQEYKFSADNEDCAKCWIRVLQDKVRSSSSAVTTIAC